MTGTSVVKYIIPKAIIGKYTVSAYENSEIPDPFWIDQGTFDSADEAIRCAEAVIDCSLAGLFEPGKDADYLRLSYLCYGEVPSIFNEQGLNFEPYVYVYRRIRELTGESEWRPTECAIESAAPD